MKLNTFKQTFLQSWNIKQDARVQFLIWVVWWNIDNFLDKKWAIDCFKIDKAILNNTFNFSQDTLFQVRSTVSGLRSVFSIQSQISYEVEKCETFEDMVNVLKNRWKSLSINAFILNKVISRADSLEKAMKVISKYWKWVELNISVLNNLFKLSTSLEEKKELLEKFWNEKQIDIYMLNMMLAHSEDLDSFWEIVFKYWEWLSKKINAVTLIILLKTILKTPNFLEKKHQYYKF